MVDFLAAWLLPPGINILFLGIGFLIHHWWKWSGRLLMAASLISLYLFSTMAAGNRMLYNLQQSDPVAITNTLQHKKNIAIVVLGGGRNVASPEFDMEDTVSPLTLERLRYAANLVKTLEFPVLLSGGRPDDETTAEAVLMNQVMIENFNLPVQFLETESQNTIENAFNSNALLKKNNINSVILVTHAWHMKRALAHFKAAGLIVYPAPMGFVNKLPTYRNQVQRYYPSSEGLRKSAVAIIEHVSLWWNKPQPPEPDEPDLIQQQADETNPSAKKALQQKTVEAKEKDD